MSHGSATTSHARKRGSTDEYGVLEDELDLAPDPLQVGALEPQQVLALEGRAAGVGVGQSEQEPPDRRLARARLADEAVRLPFVDVEVHVVDGADGPMLRATTRGRIDLRESSCLEEGSGHRGESIDRRPVRGVATAGRAGPTTVALRH